MKNNSSSKGSFSVIGTPFEPLKHGKRKGADARIMPSQFFQPMSPVRYTLLRNTVPDDLEESGNFFL